MCRSIASKWRILTLYMYNIFHKNLSLALYFKPINDIVASTTLSLPLHILPASTTHSHSLIYSSLSRPLMSLYIL
jgi:hypothetical protein